MVWSLIGVPGLLVVQIHFIYSGCFAKHFHPVFLFTQIQVQV